MSRRMGAGEERRVRMRVRNFRLLFFLDICFGEGNVGYEYMNGSANGRVQQRNDRD